MPRVKSLRPRIGLATALAAAVLAAGCEPRESLEDARARAGESVALAEIADLHKLIAKAEAGQLSTETRVAIGIAESVSKELLEASLPQEKMIGDRLIVRLETAQPFFRGNNAILVCRASARTVRSTAAASAHLELGGRLTNFRIDQGKLVSGVEIVHFKVLDSSLGDMGSDVLESIVGGNLDSLSGLLPGLEIPVTLEESIPIAGLNAGVVQVKGGSLPLKVSLAEVIPVKERLWVLLDVSAGPWTPNALAEKPE
jgi:hypothetical protein